MNVAVVCIALLGLLLFGLGFAVSVTRGQKQIHSGVPTHADHDLVKLIRAHGNTAEYAPMFAVLFFLVGSRDPATWVLWTMILATVFRYAIALGMLLSESLDAPHPLRFVGALGTYVTGILLCVAAFLQS